VGELVYQGVASQASHEDRDNAIEGDLRYASGAHTIGVGFYVGVYKVQNSDNSLVFRADASGQQTSNVPVRVLTGSSANNVVSSLYVGDLWQPNPHVSLDIGLRGDDLTGDTHAQQLSPRFNFSVRPNSASAFHAGFARYLQVPLFLGIAPGTLSVFAGTTAAGPPGATLPLAEDDYEYDAGGVVNATATTSGPFAIWIPDSSAWYRYLRPSTTATAIYGERNSPRVTRRAISPHMRTSRWARIGNRVW
jgi:hypothetical protein